MPGDFTSLRLALLRQSLGGGSCLISGRPGARHRRTIPFQASAANSVCPFGENAMAVPLWLRFKETNSRRFAAFQSFIVPSKQAEAMVLPFGEKATALTPSFCSIPGGISFQKAVSQNLIQWSAPQVARTLLSGEKPAHSTTSVCPVSTFNSLYVLASQTFAIGGRPPSHSRPTAASNFPSGENVIRKMLLAK